MWQLPGPSAFLDDIVDHLASGTTLLIGTPVGFDVAALRGHVAHSFSGHRVISISAAECNRAVPTAAWILDVLGVGRSDRGSDSIDDLIALDDVSGSVLWIDGFTDDDEHRDAWRELALDWSRAVRRCDQLGAPVLVLCASGGSALDLALDEPGMAVVYWWGRLHRIDIDLHLHLEARRHSAIHRAVSAEIAQFDPDLALLLAESQWSSLTELSQILSDVGERPAPDMHLREAEEAVPLRHGPAWARGSVDRYDNQRRPAIHACCFIGDQEELRQRQWGGQVRTILPSLEAMRRRVVERALAEGYITRSTSAGEFDFGPLAFHISAGRADRDRRRLGDFAHKLRIARNSLAHLDPVELSQYDRIVDSARELGLT